MILFFPVNYNPEDSFGRLLLLALGYVALA